LQTDHEWPAHRQKAPLPKRGNTGACWLRLAYADKHMLLNPMMAAALPDNDDVNTSSCQDIWLFGICHPGSAVRMRNPRKPQLTVMPPILCGAGYCPDTLLFGRAHHALRPAGLDWLPALRAPWVWQLAVENGPLQWSSFDGCDLAGSPARAIRRQQIRQQRHKVTNWSDYKTGQGCSRTPA
jgi:hypothetical protein